MESDPDTCMRIDCDREATSIPMLRVPALGWPLKFHTPAELIVRIKCCKEHFEELAPEELLTPEIKEMCTLFLQSTGRAHADFTRCELVAIGLDDPRYRKMVLDAEQGEE